MKSLAPRFPPKRFLLVLVALIGAPATVSAHERWFVPVQEQPPTDWGAIFSWAVLIALVLGFATVGLLAVLQRVLGDPLWPRPPFFQRIEPCSAALLGVQTAIAMIFAATHWQLFVPNIDLPHDVFGAIVAGFAIVAAFSFITGVMTRIGALMTAALVVATFGFANHVEEVFEQVLFLGIAFYLVAVGREVIMLGGGDRGSPIVLTDWMRPHALGVLRVTTGLSILILAFTEKLLNVQLGMKFLAEYPHFNVGHELGIAWFTDHRFVLVVGVIEAIAGLALIAGFLPRLVILALWIPFNLGIAFLPPQELIGHLPILSTMYVLLVRGAEGVPAWVGTPAAAGHPRRISLA